MFYGCDRYPKCKFTSAHKPLEEPCPKCGSPYLVFKNLKSGPIISCPNNKGGEEKTRRRRKAEPESTVKCDYSRPAPPEMVPPPRPETAPEAPHAE
ncbi:MAG TPA: topoisomerase DNA-binding C4 zinc finger domain-containing protein, partial [Terriglobales bacterium]|nr:topoisomerase DNA-binding C4 zinc finger domain-containing protein [Terriglobales bacterium]